jgi:Fungal specific transcription factor domain
LEVPALPTPPESGVETLSLVSSHAPTVVSTPNSEYTSDTVEFRFDDFLRTEDSTNTISILSEMEISLALHAPLSNGTPFETIDLPYAHFFMTQMPNYLWFAGIDQPVIKFIMAKALDQPVLQHAVLCTAAAMLSESGRSPPSRYLEHKAKTLGLLRGHIDNLEIDEGVAAAVFFMLFVDIGRNGARSHLRGLKSVLDYLRRKSLKVSVYDLEPNGEIHMDEYQDADVTGVSPLAWLIWAWGIRMDIGLATIDGKPMIAPLPAGSEYETFHRSWISSLSDPSIPDSTDWGLANFTLDNIMHRGCHVARRARMIRASTTYTLDDEITIHHLCDKIDADLENWRQQPLFQQTQLLDELYQSLDNPVDPECCFLHYPPVIIHNRIYTNLILDYRTAKIYLSLVAYPQPGPGPAGSGRFQHAMEICRIIAAKPFYQRDDIRGAEESFSLFLAGVAFGGADCYPLESRWAQRRLEEFFPIWSPSFSIEEMLRIWLQNCPCVPMVREKNFPWTVLSSIGIQTGSVPMQESEGPYNR